MIPTKPRSWLFGFLVIVFTPFISASPITRIIATIPVGHSPAGIAITPNKQFAYVANSNEHKLPDGSTVSVLDLTTNTLLTTIRDPSFDQPYTVTINKAGTIAYVTNSNSSTISLIDVATNRVTGTITGFDGPSGMAITADGSTAYVNNYGSPGGVGSEHGTTVSVVDLTTHTITKSITVGRAPASLAITPNGAFVYVINYVDGNPGTGTASIIQTSTNSVVGTITGFSGPFTIVITPHGQSAYVTNFGSNDFSPVGTTVSVIDLRNNIISDTIRLGTQPSGIDISPDGLFSYVTNYNTLYMGPHFTQLTPGIGTVNIIDLTNNSVLSSVLIVGASPHGIVLKADGKHGYVANYTANTISVINIHD